jgi:cytochrome P450 family 110
MSGSKLPPGPKFSLLQTALYTRDAYRFLIDTERKYGDPFMVPTLNGTIVVTGVPSTVQQIFSAEPDTYLPFGASAIEPVVGPNSLLLVHGAQHRRDRKLLTPPLHGTRMRAYAETIRQAAKTAMSSWREHQPFVMQTSTQWISLEVILRAVFGVQGEARLAAFRAAIIELVAAAVPSLLFFPVLRRPWGGLSPYNRYARAMAEIDRLIHEEIAARRADAGTTREDILSLLLSARDDTGAGMSEPELRDELLTLLFAGHETTGIALAWAIYWLHQHPPALERLRADIDALGDDPEPDAIAKLPYLDAVCNETLRLHPIVPDVPRMLARPLELAGYQLAPPLGVAVATTLVHRREDLYPEPAKFRPERFLERRFGPFEFTPFGGGHRRCIGAAFATYELKLVLATFLRHTHLELAEPGAVLPARRNVVLGPDTGVRMVLRERRAHRSAA